MLIKFLCLHNHHTIYSYTNKQQFSFAHYAFQLLCSLGYSHMYVCVHDMHAVVAGANLWVYSSKSSSSSVKLKSLLFSLPVESGDI